MTANHTSWDMEAILFGTSAERARGVSLGRTIVAIALPLVGLPLLAGTFILGGGEHPALLRFVFGAGLAAVPFFPLAVIAARLGLRSGRIGCVPALATGAVIGALALPLALLVHVGATPARALPILSEDLPGLIVAMLGAATIGMFYAASVWVSFFLIHTFLYRDIRSQSPAE